MELLSLSEYLDDVKYVAELPLPWEKLNGKSMLITGATGLIGSFLIDVLMYRNQHYSMSCRIIAVGRNAARATERFKHYENDKTLSFLAHDIQAPFTKEEITKADYLLHLASNTHPVQYATDPIGTITTNIIGLINILELGANCGCCRVLFASSNEIYGENRGDQEFFDEDYCGYINSNTLRAGYPESKRCGEALCQAYIAQKGLDVVIARLTRSYGPTMLSSDTKAINQFLKRGIAGEDIVLKSAGNQYYSYTYMADAVSGLLTVLLCGEKGQAYNIADEASDIRLKDLAQIIADASGTKVIFELPDAVEAAGYSKATKARLDGSKVRGLGWAPKENIESGIRKTLALLGKTTEVRVYN